MRKQRKPKTQSPIKDRPLRYAGDSGHDMVYEQFSIYAAGAMTFVGCFMSLLFIWILELSGRPPNTWTLTTLFGAGMIAGAYIMWSQYREVGNTRLGIDGERAVAQALIELASEGYRFLHDIKLGNSPKSPNIDHVLVGPEGVFVIETKMLRKRIDERQDIGVSGDDILVNGHKLPRSPIAQVRGSLRYITEELGPLAKSCPIRGVVVFPGWWTTGGFDGEIWVLNEKAIVTKLKRSNSSAVSDQQRDQIYHLLSKLEKTKLQIA